jgi:hypothetical protein
MKKIVLFYLFVLSSFYSAGQQNSKNLIFESIEMVDSTTKKETLYLNAVEWVGKHFANANKVIQISDKEAGIILVKGSFKYEVPGNMLSGAEKRMISFMLKLSFKDGKYKMEMSDFIDDVLGNITEDDYQDDASIKKNMQKQWKIAQQETQSNIVAVHKSIKEFMEKNINW